jgi:nucleoside-diphosphate-sugar epimerase
MLKEYIYIIKDAVDKNAQLMIGAVPYAPNQVMMLEVDISKLTQHTGFYPEYSFEEGIAETIEWIRRNTI